MIHSADVLVRRTDVDASGRISTVAFLRYLQEARVAMLFGGEGMGARIGRGVVVAGHDVQFVRPLAYRSGALRVRTWVRELRPGSFTLGYEVVDPGGEDVRYVLASSRMVAFDLDAGRPRRLSVEERDLLEPWRHDGPQPASHHQPVPLPARTPSGGPAKGPADGPVPAGARFRVDVAMRFDDLDAYRHVNNVIYASYLEEAVEALLSDARALDEDSVLAHLQLRYLQALDLRADGVRVELEPTHVGSGSVTFQWRITGDDVEHATGQMTWAAVGTADWRPRPLSDAELKLLSGAVLSAATVQLGRTPGP